MNDHGFILLETIAALLLIGLALFPLAAILVHVDGLQRGAELRFRIEQRMESEQNRLASLAGDAPEASAGNHERRDPPFAIRWRVTEERPGLRLFRLQVVSGPLQRHTRFYRSRLVEEVMNGQRIRHH